METAAALGLLLGLLIGFAGMGGGSLMTPLLILLLGIPPVTAVGTDLIYMGSTKLIGAIQHYKQGGVDVKVARLLILGGLPSSLLGASIVSAYRLKIEWFVNELIETLLAIMLLLTSASLLHQVFNNSRKSHGVGEDKRREILNIGSEAMVVLLGVLVGFAVSITSIGSGVLLMPILSLLLRIPIKKLVGTSLVFATAITIIAGLVYAFSEAINIELLTYLIAGSIPGVFLGSKLNSRSSEKLLALLLAPLMLVISFMLLYR